MKVADADRSTGALGESLHDIARHNTAGTPTDVIPVAPDAVVRSGYLVETTSALKRGMRVLVERPANAPADTIQIEGFGG